MKFKSSLYPIFKHQFRRYAIDLGLELHETAFCFDVCRKNKVVRISRDHILYLPDIINSFDYYFDAVHAITIGFGEYTYLVDYSTPRFHAVNGFDLFPVLFPSFAEPLTTTLQYLDFAKLKEGFCAIDLGAYSGLSAILMKEVVGESGQVIAVDADKKNIACLEQNLALYKKITGAIVQKLEAAVWIHSDGLEFSSEGNMGSSASEIVGMDRGETVLVPSITLSGIAREYSLNRVDFIKCDIEGAENVIFQDCEFFSKYRPKIIVEPHLVEGSLTTEKFTNDLKQFGYSFRQVVDKGMGGPLIECIPSS